MLVCPSIFDMKSHFFLKQLLKIINIKFVLLCYKFLAHENLYFNTIFYIAILYMVIIINVYQKYVEQCLIKEK